MRATLAANSDKWFHRLVISSLIVVAGVAFEAPEATIALKRWYALWRDRIVSPVNERSLAIPASYLGLLLVVGGVAGEGVFEFLASSADASLRAHDEQILGAIDQEVAMAQYLLSDRAIIDPDALKARLAQFKGKTIFFGSYVNDGDGYFLCEQLLPIANSAGIILRDQCGTLRVEPPFTVTGIQVFAPDDPSIEALLKALVGATLFGVSGVPEGNVPHPSITGVFVGRKPQAHIGWTAPNEEQSSKHTNAK